MAVLVRRCEARRFCAGPDHVGQRLAVQVVVQIHIDRAVVRAIDMGLDVCVPNPPQEALRCEGIVDTRAVIASARIQLCTCLLYTSDAADE